MQRNPRVNVASATPLARPRRVLVALMAVSLLALVAQPAAAADKPLTGTGLAPTGEEYIKTNPQDPAPVPPFCLEVLESTYTFPIEEGQFMGDHEPVLYTVMTDKPVVEFTTNERYFISPEGTYGERLPDGTCDPTTYGPLDPVDTTVTVRTPNYPPGITCDSSDVDYFRVNTEQVFEWQGACTVSDGLVTGSTPASTQHLFEATIAPPLQPSKGMWTYDYTPPPS